ncbi:hypothetical protein A1O1_00546 [Capronia coronata CBS 617.96]|uniref:Nicotinamide riboside kinase n=1 Tax=Capronia coronata CBS 617.96 TaxID=1182541 RepID=W9Z0H7_9EURO|nr:uncharacterized protein A1O1_00546 [Capronia coronata CBS 617.96]EXJ95425.1 hypothetical protein A1O1_00546 [Capronia coronata CBS 617.96]
MSSTSPSTKDSSIQESATLRDTQVGGREKGNGNGNTALNTILIGISGPSSSGKTTLARLLRTIFDFEVTVTIPVTIQEKTECRTEKWKLTLFVLHEDDFYKTDQDVPIRQVTSPEHGTRDLQDWDCVESLDLPLLENTFRHVRDHGTLPPELASKEDQNAIGPSAISDADVQNVKEQVKTWFEKIVQDHLAAAARTTNPPSQDPDTSHPGLGLDRSREIRICVLDGFLLYPAPPESTSTTTDLTSSAAAAAAAAASSSSRSPQSGSRLSPPPPSTSSSLLTHLHEISLSLLDRRLFLPVTRDQMLTRRQARMGYVTLEGFWVDPPGYVEDVVWPNYARDHAWMFVDGDVDGAGVIDQEKCKRHGVDVCPGRGSMGLRDVLDWAVERVEETVVQKLK